LFWRICWTPPRKADGRIARRRDGPDHQAAPDEVARIRPDAATFHQAERLGTAHAVLAARDALARAPMILLVAFAIHR